MYLCYFDEAGDDGYPKFSSEIFVLTSVYMHHQNWKENYKLIKKFRSELSKNYNFPVKYEFHTNPFIKNKNPYKSLSYTPEQRKEILIKFFENISSLKIEIVNVLINKKNIKSSPYDVSDNALTYNIQRIENTLCRIDPTNKFMIITDEGRLGAMVKTARRIQKINYIPSKMPNSLPQRKEIQGLIEDPVAKRSEESYFIQIADAVSYIVYLYGIRNFLNKNWSPRTLNVLDYGEERYLLDSIKNVLNLKASSNNAYGIVHYPK